MNKVALNWKCVKSFLTYLANIEFASFNIINYAILVKPTSFSWFCLKMKCVSVTSHY